MDLGRVVTELEIDDSRALLALEWEPSQSAMPEGELPFPFLSPEFVGEACRSIYLSDDIAEAAIAAARRIAERPALSALAWHWCLYRCKNYPNRVADRWPSLEGALQDAAGMFYVIALLSHVPEMHAINRAHSIPDRVVRDSMQPIYQRVNLSSGDSGRWGLNARKARGLANYVRGDCYAMGRLEYQPIELKDPIRVYRHAESSLVVALSEDGVAYRPDGHTWMEGDEDAAPRWHSRFVVRGGEIIGNPILPTGRAVPEEVRLPTAHWHQVLGQGDRVVFFHIPEGSHLDLEECGASFHTAMEFFPKHFPESPFSAFFCWSWLLDTQLEEWLSPTSNLVRFQREFYLYPGEISEESILSAVFGAVPADVARAPRDTKLQRAILDHMSAGKSVIPRAGRCFLLPEDLDEWGTQVYRKKKFPWHLLGKSPFSPGLPSGVT